MTNLSIAPNNTSSFRNRRFVSQSTVLTGIAAVLAGCGGGDSDGDSGPISNAPKFTDITSDKRDYPINSDLHFRVGNDEGSDVGSYEARVGEDFNTGDNISTIGLMIDSETGVITGRLTELRMVTIVVRSEDSDGMYFYAGREITAVGNSPPEVNDNIVDQPENIGEPINSIDVTNVLRDPNNDVVTYDVEFSRDDSGLIFNEENSRIDGVLTGTGDVNVTVSATDANGSGQTTTYSIVIEANHVPELVGEKLEDVRLTTNNNVNLPINVAPFFRDLDENDTLTYDAKVGEDFDFGEDLSRIGLSIDKDTGVITGPFLGREDATVIVRVTDSRDAYVDSGFEITRVANSAPNLDSSSAVGDRTETIDELIDPIDVTAGFSDPDGDELTYTVIFSYDDSGLDFDEDDNEIRGTLIGL